MKTLDEVLSLRLRDYIFTYHFDEWCERRAKAQSLIEMIAQLNDLCGEKYNRKIWADECVHHSLFKEYAAHLSFSNADEVTRTFNNLMCILDVLTLAREIDDFIEWQQLNDKQAARLTKECEKQSTLMNTAMSLMVEGDQYGSGMLEKFAARESPLFQELTPHLIRLNEKYFAKRGTKTKKGWLCSALGDLISDEYPCRAAFIAKLADKLGSTKVGRQSARNTLKKGYA